MIRKIAIIVISVISWLFALENAAVQDSSLSAAIPGSVDSVYAPASTAPPPDSAERTNPGSLLQDKPLPVELPEEKETLVPAGVPVFTDPKDISRAVQIPGGVLYGEFSKEDGPFLLTGSVIVPADQKLQFGPGSVIYVGGKYTSLTVYGQLIANGTVKEPVVFQSANSNPNPWDWDRIYIRSRKLSEFTWCIIRHANYGIFVENGTVDIINCTFEHNSLHGIVVKNSDVSVIKSTLQRGHVLALFCMEGSNVRADSLSIINNITGIACENKSSLQMNCGLVSGNNNGIAVTKGASVSIIATDIIKNRIGIVSEVEIPKKMREMVFHNTVDAKIVSPRELVSILKPPAEITAIALRKEKSEVQTNSNFKAGFSALQVPREATASFIGNVSSGVRFFYPVSRVNPKDGSFIRQTKYIGEYDDTWYNKFQPEFVVFAQGKKGLIDVNLNTDFYFNDWIDNQLHLRANLFSLSMNFGNFSTVIGDFYENISETSMSGRKLRGIKLFGNAWDMGRGMKRIEFKLLGGETEIKKDRGEHEPDIIGDTVAEGFSVRQQLTYLADMAIRPAQNVTISARGIISHDQDEKGLFSEAIQDSAANKPLSGQTGCLGVNVTLFEGKMDVSLEVDIGARDTVDSAHYADIAWYKPQVINSISRVFGVLRLDSSNAAVVADISGVLFGYDIKSSFMEIAKNYFSAGNPYLEADRRVLSLNGSRQFSEFLSVQAGYEFELTSKSKEFDVDKESPTRNNTVAVSGEYSFGENKPALAADYELMFVNNRQAGMISSITGICTVSVEADYTYNEVDNTAGLEVKQRFANGIDYSAKYSLRNINDFSDYPLDPIEAGKYAEEDRWEHDLQARIGFSVKKILQNKTSFKIRFRNKYVGAERSVEEKQIDFRIGDDARVTIIPRKLIVALKGEFRRKLNNKLDSTNVFIPTLAMEKNIEGNLKYMISSHFSLILSGKYEDHSDEAPNSAENYTVKIVGLHVMYLF